ncbi:MAG: hypothetical protein ACREJO_00800 [Phycisphaerales bacterium]
MTTRTNNRILSFLFLAAIAACTAGCYERVVGASGMGAQSVETEEPYATGYRVDNVLMGKQNTPRLNSQPRNTGTSQNEPF